VVNAERSVMSTDGCESQDKVAGLLLTNTAVETGLVMSWRRQRSERSRASPESR
jgi:hypothetical protein